MNLLPEYDSGYYLIVGSQGAGKGVLATRIIMEELAQRRVEYVLTNMQFKTREGLEQRIASRLADLQVDKDTLAYIERQCKAIPSDEVLKARVIYIPQEEWSPEKLKEMWDRLPRSARKIVLLDEAGQLIDSREGYLNKHWLDVLQLCRKNTTRLYAVYHLKDLSEIDKRLRLDAMRIYRCQAIPYRYNPTIKFFKFVNIDPLTGRRVELHTNSLKMLPYEEMFWSDQILHPDAMNPVEAALERIVDEREFIEAAINKLAMRGIRAFSAQNIYDELGKTVPRHIIIQILDAWVEQGLFTKNARNIYRKVE